MICKHGDFPIEIIQGNSYRRVYTFYDANDNILNDDLLQSVVLSVARLNYSQVLNWNEDEQGYVFLLSAETTDEFPYCKGTYDVTLTFKDTQVETEIYRSPLQIFKKNVVNPIVDNNGYMTCDNSKVTVKTGIQVIYTEGTEYHDELLHRDLPDQHPMSAITGLEDELDGKQPVGDYATTQELDELASIVEGKADSDDIPTKTSELQNDSGFITSIPSEYVTDSELNTAIQGVRADIPTKVSDLTNDSNFATEGYVDNADTVLQGQIDDLQAEKMPLTEIDTAPTEGSTNLVESGGVYDAIDGVQQDVDSIQGLISPQATSTNKLVSASEMGDAISSVEAKQLYATASQGSFATKAQLLGATTYYNADGTVATPTKNDVAYVLADESHDNKSAKYVIADVTQSGIVWGLVITFSDVSFSQAQMDAVNSGATQQKISAYDAHIVNKTNPHEVTYQQLGGTNPSYTKGETDTLLGGKLSDAPSDGKQYARKDGAWSEVISGSSSAIIIPYSSLGVTPYTFAEVKALLDSGNEVKVQTGSYIPHCTAYSNDIITFFDITTWDLGAGVYTITYVHLRDNNAKYTYSETEPLNPVVYARIAPNYSDTADYAVGDYCTRFENIYRCTTPIVGGEEWNAAHWTIVTVMGEIKSKQDVITDLDDIRSGAALGATSVQPSALTDYALKTDLDSLDERVEELEQHGTGGGIPDAPVDGKQYARKDGAWSEVQSGSSYDDTAIKARVSAIEAKESGWNAKQDAITDLATIRSGAALGATALQSVPNTYRTAAQQDIIDNGKQPVGDYALRSELFSGNYNDLTNKPTIPSAVTESTVSGWGFTKNTGTYSKPSTGIPKTDLASAVQTSLGKADTALQSVPTTYALKTDIPTDAHINSLIDAKLGVIENGSY